MPLYRETRYLRSTLESLAAQTYLQKHPDSVEILIIQNGSRENLTPFIPDSIRPLVKEHFIEQPGVSNARNVGVSKAEGEWIAFLDADDHWLPGKLEAQAIRIAAAPQAGLVYTNSYWMDGEGRRFRRTQLAEYGDLPEGKIAQRLLERNYIITSSVALPRKVYDKMGGFDCGLQVCEDWDLWIRLAREYEIFSLAEPLIEYRIHPRGTHTQISKMLECSLKVLEKNYSAVRNGGSGKSLDDLKGQVYSVLAGSAIFAGDPALGRRYASQALAQNKKDKRAALLYLLSFCPAPVKTLLLRLRDLLPFLP